MLNFEVEKTKIMKPNKQELSAQARQTGAAILRMLDSFTDEQFNTQPEYGGWTAGQVAEHLLLSAAIVETIGGNTIPTSDRQVDLYLPILAEIFLDFDKKIPSPDFLLPSEGPHDKEELLNKTKIFWDRLGMGIRLLDLTATCLDYDFPGFGKLTRLEWVNFYLWHTQRHLHQLRHIYAAVDAVPA
jgi:hypothetical protein